MERSARVSLGFVFMGTVRALVVAASLAALLVGLPSATTIASDPTAAMAAASSSLSVGDKHAPGADVVSDTRQANEILGKLKATHRYLDDVTVTVGTTPRGEEAVAYYTSGEIVISRDHTVGIDKILGHEIWHVIDWRDNGQLDWKESLPPANSAAYLRD